MEDFEDRAEWVRATFWLLVAGGCAQNNLNGATREAMLMLAMESFE